MRRILATAAAVFLLSACAMLREGNPVTTPDPKQYPCGLGVECTDTVPHGCCGKGGVCATDSGGPYCQYNVPDDPADPTMLRRKPKRDERSPLR